MPSRLFSLCLALIVLIGPLAVHLFMPAIPAIKAEFQISEALAYATFNVGIIALALSTLAYGTLSDRYGRRPVLLSGLALFLIGCAIAAAATSLSMLMVGRVIQAVGAGCATTLVRTIARDAYGQEHLVKAIAYITMFYTLGPMISPLMGGILIDTYGWRATFVFGLVFGGVISAAAWLVVYETHTGMRRRLDPTAVLRSYIDPFRSARFAAFVLQTAFSTGVFFPLTTAAAVIMKETLDRPATEYGLYFLVFPLGFLSGNLVSSRLSGGRVSIETMVLAGSVLNLATTALQAVLLLSGVVTPWSLFGPGLLMTFAQGLALPSAQAGAIQMMPTSVGTAAGLAVFVQMLAGALMGQLYGVFAVYDSIVPLVAVCMLSAMLALVCGLVPWLQARR